MLGMLIQRSTNEEVVAETKEILTGMAASMEYMMAILTIVQIVFMILFFIFAVKIGLLLMDVLKEAHAALWVWNERGTE